MTAHDDDDTDRDRHRRYDRLAARIRACRRCEGMNIPGETQAAPGYGCQRSPVVIVGQSLCRKCMETQIPFTWR
jgi:uracil-DNA glycosylase